MMIGVPAMSTASGRAHVRSRLLRQDARMLSSAALCLAFVAVVALSFTAMPRRTGDAHQYLAMALQLTHLRPPALSMSEEAQYQRWLESQSIASGFPDGARAIRQPTLVHDGRQELSHFWAYPLFVAPVLAVAGALGLHPSVAFTFTNAALLGAALWAATRAFGPTAALLMLASPLVWFVGKAQVEVFTVALLCLAMAAAAAGRWGWASIAAALASTQNLPIAATIPLFWAGGIATWAAGSPSMPARRAIDRRAVRSALTFGIAATGIAILHPAYYLWQLGVVTPQQLNGGIAGEIPAWSRFLAPLVDPDIGFVPWMPVTATVVLVGFLILIRPVLQRRPFDGRLAPAAICAWLMAVWFLFVFSQTTNVNSGGTVHVSRYALWLLPLTLPAAAAVTSRMALRFTNISVLAALVLALAYAGYFQPDQPERYVEHSPQAAWLLSHAPGVYRPLPEIFVERTLHIDGGARASAADPACRLILLVAASPEQPCAFSETERAQADAVLANDAAAVWIRREPGGASIVSSALAKQ